MHVSDMLHRGTSNQAPAEEGCSRPAKRDFPTPQASRLGSLSPRTAYLPQLCTAHVRQGKQPDMHTFIAPFRARASINLTAFPCACCMEETNILKPHADSQHPRCSDSRSTRGHTCGLHSEPGTADRAAPVTQEMHLKTNLEYSPELVPNLKAYICFA